MSQVPFHLTGTRIGDLGGNGLLRVGEVYERFPPGHKRNRNKLCDEYRVYVQHTDSHVYDPKDYYNCTLLSGFGGLADKSHHALRVNEKKSGIEKGSKVLILCINGDMRNAIIIGGIRDSQELDKGQDGKDDQDRFGKHHYYWIFNGIEVFVNDDGEYTLTYKGKTENDGKRNKDVKESSVGSIFSMLKDGIIKQVAIKEWRVEVSNGKAIIKPKDGLHVGEATDKMLLGESFRKAQKTMNDTLKTQCDNLQKALIQAASALTTGSGAVAPAAGLAAPLSNAGIALNLAAGYAQAMSTAIDSFEQQAQAKNSFTSKLHKND